MKPTWSKLDNGVEIYGEKNGVIGDKTIGTDIGSIDLGYVTPGLWKITVEGRLNDEANTLVMQGSTKAYFRNAGTDVSESKTATVYVAPVKRASNGTLHISIQMEDLGDPNANKIKYVIDNGTVQGTIDGEIDSSKNVGTYTKLIEIVESGYHYITFTVPGYDGGVTKSFLMLPGTGSTDTTGGNDVKIIGSVVPSKFATTGASIKVINIDDKIITVGSGEGSKKFEGTGTYEPYVATALTVPVSIGTYTKPTDLPKGTTLTNPTYTWYVNGKEDTSTSYNISSGTMTIPNEPGDYTITCIISVTYTDADGNEYTIYGHEKQAAVVRLKNKVATTTP